MLNNYFTAETVEGFVFVSKDKMLMLKEIIEKTEAKIVLASYWRLGWIYKTDKEMPTREQKKYFYELNKIFADFGIAIMDRTPHLSSRGQEIDTWLKEWEGEKIEKYVVLDDMDEEHIYPCNDHLVQTHLSRGLTTIDVQKVIDMLNN